MAPRPTTGCGAGYSSSLTYSSALTLTTSCRVPQDLSGHGAPGPTALARLQSLSVGAGETDGECPGAAPCDTLPHGQQAAPASAERGACSSDAANCSNRRRLTSPARARPNWVMRPDRNTAASARNRSTAGPAADSGPA